MNTWFSRRDDFKAEEQKQKLAPWHEQIREWKNKHPLGYIEETDIIKPQFVVQKLHELTQGDAIIATEVGQNQMWAAQFYKIDTRFQWISSGGAGTMGFGFPAAVGAQLARPDKTVVAIVGDGGFQMTMSELATAVINKLPVKIMIINNNYLGMVRQWQHLFYENRLSGVDLEGNPNFVKLAESYGCKGSRVRRSADVRRILKSALDYNDGPCVIDVEVEKEDNVYPMVPSGAPLTEMLLEAPKAGKQLEKPVGST